MMHCGDSRCLRAALIVIENRWKPTLRHVARVGRIFFCRIASFNISDRDIKRISTRGERRTQYVNSLHDENVLEENASLITALRYLHNINHVISRQGSRERADFSSLRFRSDREFASVDRRSTDLLVIRSAIAVFLIRS